MTFWGHSDGCAPHRIPRAWKSYMATGLSYQECWGPRIFLCAQIPQNHNFVKQWEGHVAGACDRASGTTTRGQPTNHQGPLWLRARPTLVDFFLPTFWFLMTLIPLQDSQKQLQRPTKTDYTSTSTLTCWIWTPKVGALSQKNFLFKTFCVNVHSIYKTYKVFSEIIDHPNKKGLDLQLFI